MDVDQSNSSIPLSNWDGLLAAELLLRPNNEHSPIDLSLPTGRRRMSEAIRKMDFIDSHDLINIADSLDNYQDGPLPAVPKMSILEMERLCFKTNTSLTVTEGSVREDVFVTPSPNRIDYNSVLNRYTLNTATLPEPSPDPTGDMLRVVFWNCNGWDYHKSQKVAELTASIKADVICITDSRINKHREISAVDSFAKVLLIKTDKTWRGTVSPMRQNERVGGDIIMFSNLISKPKVTHLIPFGVLSSLDCRWGVTDISILSVYRPILNDDPGSLRSIVEKSIDTNLENRLWKTMADRTDLGPCYIGGDFNLSPTQLDSFISTSDLTARRIPMHGEIFSFRRWDSIRQIMQRSAIDHVLWNGPDHPQCSLAPDGYFALDHIPVILNTKTSAAKRFTRITKLKRNPTLNSSDKGACRKFVSRTEKLANSLKQSSTLDSISLLELTEKSVKIVHDIQNTRNSLLSPSNFSPIARLLSLRLSALGSTVRLGSKGDLESLRLIVNRLKRDEAAVRLNEDEQTWCDDNDLHTDPLDWGDWKNKYPTTALAAAELLRIRSMLTKENKREYRRIHGGWMSKIQEAADSGRIGRVIQAVVGRDQSYLMESLIEGDETITDGHAIALSITGFFRKWFSRLPEEKVRDAALAKCVTDVNRPAWDTLMNDIGVPKNPSDKLWYAFQKKPSTPAMLQDAKLLATFCPTLEEFQSYIKSLDSTSAPGASGLSYLMVKLWPEDFVDRAYTCLCNAWQDKKGLEGWAIKILAPIPKKPNPTKEDLRPLMLVEVMRKIWVGLIMGRIRSFWSKHSLIDERQHAYLRGKGTQTAIPQLINAMESAKEFKTDLFMSSWDMSKAFDNLSREMILLSLRRLHIPDEIAAYLISLDLGDKVMVRTPWLLDKLRSKDPLLTEDDYFSTEKGVGQGDIPSPLLWVAAFDIPLTALGMVNSRFKVLDIASAATDVTDIAYADDLISIVGTPEALQDKADIMSAWCLSSGVKMNTSKLRTFGISWGADRSSSDFLKIHGEAWTEIMIGINRDGFMTQLGVIWDMDLNNNKQFEAIKERLEELGSRILRYNGRVGDKILALEYCLRADISYRMQFCVWGLDRYMQLDKIYNRLVRRITRNMDSFPSKPMWALAADGGLGIQSLIDFTHKCKLRLLLRNVNKNDASGLAFQGLVARALRNGGTGGLSGRQQAIRQNLDTPIWMSSLIEWLDLMGLVITVQGPPSINGQSDLIEGDILRRMDLYSRGISLTGEESLDPEPTDIQLRAGQCWLVKGKVLEVLGFDHEKADYLEWTPAGSTLFTGLPLVVDESNNYEKYARGLGSDLQIPLSVLAKSDALVERSPDTIEKKTVLVEDGVSLRIEERQFLQSKVVRVRNRTPIVLPPPPLPDPCSLSELDSLYIHAIYTDGSWSKTDTLGSLLLSNGKVSTAGAVVVHTGRGMIPIKVIMDIDVGGAFEAEVVSLLIGHEIAKDRHLTIWTDCEAALKKLRGGGFGSLSQVIGGWKRRPNVTFSKVKAHPERRLPPQQWSQEEKGNYLADQVAGGIVQPAFTVLASQWLKKVGSSSKITINRKDGTPLIRDVSHIKSRCDIDQYLLERDEYRKLALKTPEWAGANISLHHKLLGRSNKIGDRVITSRIGLTKRWQWASCRADNQCQGCLETIYDICHPLRDCRVESMVQERDRWWQLVEQKIASAPYEFQHTLYILTKHMREDPCGETACCGSFLPNFVNSLPNSSLHLTDTQSKWVIKTLKVVAAGCRRILRLAAEVQLGPLGINYRQTSITSHFKPVNPTTPKLTIKTSNSNKFNNKTINTPFSPHDIFHVTPSNSIFYWEFKAG